MLIYIWALQNSLLDMRGALKVTEKLQYPEHSPGDLLPTATSEDGSTGTQPRGHT